MNDMMLGAIRSKTVWLGLAVAVMGAVQANAGALFPSLAPQLLGQITAALGVAVTAVRFITTVPLDQK